MTESTAVVVQFVGVIGILIFLAVMYIQRYRRNRRAAYQTGTLHPRPSTSQIYDTATVPHTGGAMANPPRDLAETIRSITQDTATALAQQYRFPLGWSVVEGRATASWGTFVGDVNHILLTAQSDGGKDNWAIGVLLSLALMHNPKDVQIAVIDGKGLDFAPWAHKQHVWRLALRSHEIAPAMSALTAERERRGEILRRAGVSKWDNYTGGDLPLLVVFISELSLLQDATSRSDLEGWLNSELAAGRAFGMRYMVATQTASNFGTRWRSQIGLAVAGYQPNASQDEPNTGVRTAEILARGGTPPSELPPPPVGAGVFTVVFGRSAVTLRAPLIDDAQRTHWLTQLPNRPEPAARPVPVRPAPASTTPAGIGAYAAPVPSAAALALSDLLQAPPAFSSAPVTMAPVADPVVEPVPPSAEVVEAVAEAAETEVVADVIVAWTPQHTVVLEQLLAVAVAGGDYQIEPSDSRLMELAYGKRATFYLTKIRVIRKEILPIVAASVKGVKV